MKLIKDVKNFNKLVVGEKQYYFNTTKKYIYIFDSTEELLFMLPTPVEEYQVIVVRAGIIGYNNGVENTKKDLLQNEHIKRTNSGRKTYISSN